MAAKGTLRPSFPAVKPVLVASCPVRGGRYVGGPVGDDCRYICLRDNDDEIHAMLQCLGFLSWAGMKLCFLQLTSNDTHHYAR